MKKKNWVVLDDVGRENRRKEVSGGSVHFFKRTILENLLVKKSVKESV